MLHKKLAEMYLIGDCSIVNQDIETLVLVLDVLGKVVDALLIVDIELVVSDVGQTELAQLAQSFCAELLVSRFNKSHLDEEIQCYSNADLSSYQSSRRVH